LMMGILRNLETEPN